MKKKLRIVISAFVLVIFVIIGYSTQEPIRKIIQSFEIKLDSPPRISVDMAPLFSNFEPVTKTLGTENITSCYCSYHTSDSAGSIASLEDTVIFIMVFANYNDCKLPITEDSIYRADFRNFNDGDKYTEVKNHIKQVRYCKKNKTWKMKHENEREFSRFFAVKHQDTFEIFGEGQNFYLPINQSSKEVSKDFGIDDGYIYMSERIFDLNILRKESYTYK